MSGAEKRLRITLPGNDRDVLTPQFTYTEDGAKRFITPTDDFFNGGDFSPECFELVEAFIGHLATMSDVFSGVRLVIDPRPGQHQRRFYPVLREEYGHPSQKESLLSLRAKVRALQADAHLYLGYIGGPDFEESSTRFRNLGLRYHDIVFDSAQDQ